MPKVLLLLVLFLLMASAGCAASPRAKYAFEDVEDVQNLESDESRFWLMSDKIDEDIANLGVLYDDPELNDYLQAIIDKLFPEFVGTMTIKAIRDPNLNAFAMANGSLYINIGMLARLDNEAELAAVLGHEGVHFTDRHVVQGMRQHKRISVLANLAAMAGYGLVGSVVGTSSVLGYSRITESQADERGFERVRDAGYDVEYVHESFERFAREIEKRDEIRIGFFSTHPSIKARANAFRLLARETHAGGGAFSDRYLAHTLKARMDALASMADQDDHVALIHILESEDRLHLFPVEARYFLAEGYRKRDDEGDMHKAESLYMELVDDAVAYGPAYARLGVIQMQNNEHEPALENFRRYLELVPDAVDKAFIVDYIAQISGSK